MNELPPPGPAAAAPARRVAPRRWWRSPPGQPGWARPTLLALTALAGVLYAWNAAGNLEIYYAAAVRSMSMSWHDFFFAAFDPAGTISLDKLPGAFWLQALSARVFGVHAWSLVAPQVVEGMASVLVLYRVVRRLAGPLAGALAAALLVFSPANVALDRGNISDSLMVLLLLLAADATLSAARTGSAGWLALASVFVGLAFQAKMIEAWLILPALASFYLVAAPGRLSRRVGSLAGAGLLVAAVSLSWMTAVSLWPASQRPYIDGSTNNSIFSQVFVYNGFGRLDELSPDELLTKAIGLRLSSTPPGWNRLLSGALGRDGGWLIPAALLALLACIALSRSRGRFFAAGCALWGLWLAVLLVSFSASSTINAYYTAALSPPIAALIATVLVLGWEGSPSRRARGGLAGAVVLSAAYAVWLLPHDGVGEPAGLAELAATLGAVAALALLLAERRAACRVAFALAGLSLVAVPAVASVSIVAKGLGPFDTPFETGGAAAANRALGGVARRVAVLLPRLEQANADQADLLATQTAAVAAPFIYDSGREVLPIGGFTGTSPQPSLAALKRLIASGDVHTFVQAPSVTDPRLVWVRLHCLTIDPGTGTAAGGLRFAVYYCGHPPGFP